MHLVRTHKLAGKIATGFLIPDAKYLPGVPIDVYAVQQYIGIRNPTPIASFKPVPRPVGPVDSRSTGRRLKSGRAYQCRGINVAS